ncbi:MAG: flagellar biosynthesis anti-sigma factor FlgM [Clostridiales bacterium]|nr:flagellar biosynthesis anti-sigma factor FlgM [Clostridiales bacterium]
MKINPIGIPTYMTVKRRIDNIGGVFAKTSGFPSGDELTLSPEVLIFSKVFAAVKEAREAAPVSEQARVSDIASRIADGSYHVDSGAVASSILGDLDG